MSVMLIHNDTDSAYNENGFAIAGRESRFFFDTSIDITTNTSGLITGMHVEAASYHPFSASNYGDVPTHPTGTKLLVQIGDSKAAINEQSTNVINNSTIIGADDNQ